MKKKIAVYIEPEDYFPKELLKEFGLGEFNTDVKENADLKETEKEKEDAQAGNVVLYPDPVPQI